MDLLFLSLTGLEILINFANGTSKSPLGTRTYL